MDSEKYIGLDVHQATIVVAVMDSSGKLVMESILETKAATILQFFTGLRGTLSVTFEEGTWAAWLYDLLQPHVDKLVVCNPRKNALLKDGNKSDRIDARKLAELLRGNGLQYVVGVQSSMTVWEPGKQPLPAKARGKMGRPPRLLHRSPEHQPVSVKQLAMSLPSTSFKSITWREGTEQKLRSRFAALRVRPAHRDYWKAEPNAEEWLLIEWPQSEKEPTKYWISTLPANTTLKALIKIAKHRWIIERDYEELKQELGLGHFEGRNWRGFHHHATLCIAAYGFLVAAAAQRRHGHGGQAHAGSIAAPPARSCPYKPELSPIKLDPNADRSSGAGHDCCRDRPVG